MVGPAVFRADAVPIAPQICGDDGKVFGQTRRHPVPRHVAQGVAMQEQQRLPMTAIAHMDACAVDLDVRRFEAFEH